MDFDGTKILNAGFPLPELYRVLSSEGIQKAEVKTGVLLYFFNPSFIKNTCTSCSKKLLAYISGAGGYVVHYAGDALVVEWAVENAQLSDTISQSVQCAFEILNMGKNQKTAHDPKRAIKIAISAGRFSRVSLGEEERRISVLVGPGVDEIRSAMALAEYEDIVLSPEAWQRCDRTNLAAKPIGDEGVFKVQHIKQQQKVSEEDSSFEIESLISGHPRRAYLLKDAEKGIVIHKCMTQTALDKIHENRQLQDLPETWPATVMFLNLQFMPTQTDRCESRLKVKEIVDSEMSTCRGEICDVFYFDEGCVFLCVVGLPGDKRQDETDDATLAAHWIHELCVREIDSLRSISVGVATGRILYELGKECKVFGQTVHLAATFAMEHPGIVSCDVATKLYSTLTPLSHLIPRRMIRPYEPVLYWDEIHQLCDEEAKLSSGVMEGRRLALAHMQTMLPYEQMVVKHASAIGHTFSVDMLKNILPQMNEEDFITPLTSMVRVGIFKCASVPSNTSSAETCDCVMNRREYVQDSVDPVWPCRLMSFCSKDGMEMVHRLIQKSNLELRAIHRKCAVYLEKKAYRCGKCEGKRFLYGHRAETAESYEHLQEIYKAIRPYEIFQSQDIPSKYQMYAAEGHSNADFLAKVKSLLREACDRTTAGSCECAQLVETVLFPRVRHWRHAGNVHNTFYYLVECAAACVYLQNEAMALEYLSEARSILENLQERKPAFPLADTKNVQICKLQQAFAHRFTGEILFRAGRILEARESFKKVLKVLNCKLPKNTAAQSVKLVREKMKKLRYRSRQSEIPEKTKLNHLQECIDCLSFLWQIGCLRGQLSSASLAVTMEINLAMESTDPFKILYSAIDFLKYSQFKGEESECRRLEEFLCSSCSSLSDHPEGQRLISRLTRTLAVVKLCTGDLEQSIEYTMQAQQLNEVLKGPGLDARATAASHLPLLLTDRYRESVQQILTLENLSKEMKSRVAGGWFYASCMNFSLYAGFAYRPFEECLSFVEESLSDANLEADKSLQLHLYSAVALWYARLANWEKFEVFFDKACEAYAQIPPSIESLSGAVMLLECSVLLFGKELTEWSRQRRSTLKRTQKLFSDFGQRFGNNHIFTPRVLHLNAYVHHMTGSKILEQDLLNDALLLCEKQGNLLDQMWIMQSQADWTVVCHDTPDEWSTGVLGMPSWDEAATLQPVQLLKYRFRLKKVDVPKHQEKSYQWPKFYPRLE